jgi:hypothetical protein
VEQRIAVAGLSTKMLLRPVNTFTNPNSIVVKYHLSEKLGDLLRAVRRLLAHNGPSRQTVITNQIMDYLIFL